MSLQKNNMRSVIIVIMIGFCIFTYLYSTTPVNCYENIIKDSIPYARSIYENRREGESCQELNMNFYVWMRSRGFHPDIQVGKKNGSGHLWIEYKGIIFDVTDPRYYGKQAKDVKDVYVPLSEMLQ